MQSVAVQITQGVLVELAVQRIQKQMQCTTKFLGWDEKPLRACFGLDGCIQAFSWRERDKHHALFQESVY